MPRFTLVLATWMKDKMENWGKIKAKMVNTETEGTKIKRHPPTESRVSEWTPLFSKHFMDFRCG